MLQVTRSIKLALWIVLSCSSTLGAAQTFPAGGALADACTGCHGVGGRSLGVMPSLVGLDQREFVNKFMAFQAGKVPGTVMSRIATGYSEAQVAALAAFFASQQR